jgi:alcohol oxidase
MKKRENGGVVDNDLNVYGTTGLKVAGMILMSEADLDMSIAPSNVGANTASTALVIGEKAAIIIAKELGISGV